MSLGFESSLASAGVTGTSTDDTTLRFSLTAARAENLILRSRVAALEQRNEYLTNRLRLYENWNTPPSKEGGAGAPPDDDHPTDQEEPNTGDDNSTDEDSTSGGSEQTQMTALAAILTPPATLTNLHLDVTLATKAQPVHHLIQTRQSGLTKHTAQSATVPSLILIAIPPRQLSIHRFQFLSPSPNTNSVRTTAHVETKSPQPTKIVRLSGVLSRIFWPKPPLDDSTGGFPTENRPTSSNGNSTSRSLIERSTT